MGLGEGDGVQGGVACHVCPAQVEREGEPTDGFPGVAGLVLGQFGVPGAVEAVESGLGGVADLPVGAGAVLGGGEAVFGVSCLAEDVLGVCGLGVAQAAMACWLRPQCG